MVTDGAASGLAELDALRAGGFLDESEYAAARASVLGIAGPGGAQRPAPPPGRPLPPQVRPSPGSGQGTTDWLVAVSVLLALVMAVAFLLVTGRLEWRPGAPSAAPVVPIPTVEASLAPEPFASPSLTESVPPTTVAASDVLEGELVADAPSVEQLVGRWVPQLSAKQVGMVVGGVTYDYDQIDQHVASLKNRFPGALLTWSGEYATFRYPDFYVVVAPVAFDDPQSVIGWCVAQGLGRDDCLAKRLAHSGRPEDNTVYQP